MATETSDAMLSLIQTHANLHEKLGKCRASARVANAECERVREQIQALQQTQREECLATQREQERVQELRLILHGCDDDKNGENGEEAVDVLVSLQKQLDQVEEEYALAVSAHHRAEQAELRWKAHKQEQVQQAIENSRKFQVQSQQWQAQAAAIEPSFLTAAALRATERDEEAVSLEALFASQAIVIVEEEDCDENDPSSWPIPDDDFELSEAIAAYIRNVRARDKASAELDDWKNQQEIVSTRRDKQLEQSQQLEIQLARIMADCDDLQSKTAELQHLTNEDVILANEYRKKMEQRRKKKSTSTGNSSARRVSFDAAAGPRNVRRSLPVPSLIPPVGNNNSSNSHGASTSTNNRASAERASTSGQAARSTTRNPYAAKRQHSSGTTIARSAADAEEPSTDKRARRDELAAIVLGPSAHARRSRRDRQFGCSFEIPNDNSGPTVPRQETEAVNHTANNQTTSGPTNSNADYDDDKSEEDDLLSYVALSKRT